MAQSSFWRNVAAAMALLIACVSASDHVFKRGSKIPMFVNKVGPYFNTHETYHYYSLPVCRPSKVVFRSLTLGEVLDGDRMAESLYDLRFQEDVKDQVLCTVTLNSENVQQLHEAIEDLYYFEFIVDDLPVRGFIGQLVEHVLPHSHEVYLWTHIDFNIDYNGNQIVAVNLTQRAKELQLPEVEEGQRLFVPAVFTYSVTWHENKNIAFASRTHQHDSFFPKTLEIHWLAIINSVVLVLLLSGFVVIFLARMLNKDFATAMKEEEDDLGLDDGGNDDQGWKVVHADVFRFPPYKSALSAVVGNGAQFLTLGFVIIAMAMVGFFNVHRHGSMNTAAVLVYALTCFVSGLVSNRLYCSMDGANWAWNIVLTASLFAVPFFLVWSCINSVAWYMGSTQALPATTIVLLLLIWLVVGFPLTVVGGISGRRLAGPFDAPCRTKNICREIPAAPLHRSASVQFLVGGFLPFSAISVELYYIFSTIWGREQYTLYGILMLVFLVLIAVAMCISVTATYFQLGGEDYRWWWRSVFTAGFCGVYVFAYGIFYFVQRSNMSGTLQTVQFFGYTFLVCYVFFLMLGTVGFLSSLTFVRFIYRNLKLD